VSFLDVNGDGLPDRLDESGRVDLNGFDVTADGAGAGRFSSVRFANADTLGHTSEWSLDVGVGAHAEAGFPAHVDLSWVWSHANEDHLVTDINGDLRPDLVSTNNGFAVRVNNGHGFEERPNWSGFTASRLSLSSSGEESEVMSRFTRSDALRQLALPYAGHVTVSGVIQKKEAAGDGVDAAIYRNAALLWSRRFAANDTAPCAPGPGNSCAGGLALDVNAGDSLYFVAGSVRETSADALLWAPVVSYDGRDPQAREPYGARTFVFDAADDFALAGYRGPSWAATAGGNIRVSGPLVKQETSDDVTLVVSVNHHGAVVPLFTRTFAAGELATFDAVPPIHVDANDLLFLRLTSRTPIDPKRIQWAPMVTYVGATDPASLPDDVRTSPAQVGIAVPQGFGGTPTQSWTATSTGAQKFHVACVTTTPATLYVQGVNRLLSVSAVSAGTPSFDVTVNASAGDPLFVSLISDSGTNTCTVNSGAVPLNVRSPRGESSNVLSGGHHNWFYGEWNGDVAFNPARLVAPRDENDRPDFVSGAPHWEVTKATVRPAWTAAGFDLYLSAEGVKPSRRGANAAGVLDQASGVTAGGDLSVLRKTAGRTEAIAAGAGGGGLSLSRGTSDTQLDLLDMNGDRYPDQVSPDGVRFSNGSSGFGDLQRIDGLGGAVRSSEDGNVSATIGIGINFTKKNANGKPTAVVSTLPSVGSTISVSQTKYDLIDVNGDNLPDRVTMNPGDGAMTVQLNLGYRFGAAESWNLPAPSASGHCNDTFDYVTSAIGSLSSLDTLNGMSFTRSSAAQAGVAVGPFGGTVSTTLARTLVELADINGDGLVDRVIKDQQQPGSGYFRVQLNLGDHWDVEHRWYIPDWPRSVSLGDGYNPGGLFQCLDAVTFSGHVEVQGSVGVPICIPLIPPTPVVGLQIEVSAQAFASTSSGLQLFLEDLDGDGLSDHVLKKAGDGNVYVKRNQAGKVNLLKAVHRPLGSTIEISYERRGNHPDMPFSQWVLAQVSVSEKPGTTPYVTRYHYDNDAVYDRTERANYGYGHLKVTLPDGSTVDRNFDNHDFYNRHAKTKEVLADAQGNLFRVETARYEDKEVTGSGSSRFPALMARTTSFYEGTTSVEASAPKTTAATFEYDRLGNVIRTTDSADAGVDDDVNATIAYQFSPNGPLTRPASIEVRDGTGRLLRQRQGTYNDNGDLIRLEQILAGGRDPENGSTYSGSKNAVWTLAYDALGNVVSSADPSGFTTTFTYDAATRTHPIEVRDSFGYVTGYNYDLKYGQLAQTTDQNGNTIARAFDGFGRIVRVVGPYDSEASPALAFEYGADAATHWAVVHHKDSTRFDTIDSATFIDSLERVVETKEETEVDQGSGTSARAGMRVSGRIGFDAKGRIVTEGQPVFDDGPANRFVEVAAKNPTTFTYDTVDRVRTVRFPTGAVTRVDYGFGAFGQTPRFLTVRTDPAGRVTRFYRDVSNNVVGVEQTNTIRGARKTLLTAYAYDALDQLTAVTDAKGNVTRLEYDTLGRNVTLDNPDLGRTEFRYDPAGTLGAKITANLAARNQQIRYFSTFGRLDRIDYPQSPDVVYTYGAPGASLNRANRIVTVTDASGVEESSYGKLGEVVQLVKTTAALNGSTPKGPYTTRFQFDDFDRLLSVVYPDGETLTYGYDAGGQVKSASGVLKGVRFDYLRYLGYDEFGERTRMILGNGVETRSTYDPVSRFLTQLRTTGAGRDLQNLRYQYDLTGTALALQNDVPVPAPSLYGGPTSQTFQYDDIAQLVGAQGTYRTGPNTTSTYTLGLNYDELGNTIAKNQLHQTGNNGKLNPEKKTSYNWAYTYAALQPHAATHVGDRTFRYDADGNQLGWDSDANGTRRTLTWDEENRLASVADNGQTTRFLYDADGTRTNKAGQNGETTYVNRWFTIRNGAIASKHIFADDVRLATKVSPDANPRSEKAYFFQADNLGSTQFVTDELGAVYQHLEYFPSGEVWVDERSETQRTPYLFSGKELDEETGLSYFGHRYYDARQGQWISTDPILDEMLNKLESADASADPFHLPGNMSGYVANDPVNQTDPDGLSRGKRLGYVGGTPGKYSTTGRTVIDRMKADKFVKGTGNKQMVFVSLGKGNKTVWKTVDKDIHMGHLVDAVRLWNGVGRFFGKKHPIVRDMMKDPDNYVLEYGPANMSKGAKLGATTQYDEPHSKLWDNLKSKDMKSWLAAFRKARKDFLTPVEWKQLRKHVPKEAQ
jgi:RHS repeat-associated protein